MQVGIGARVVAAHGGVHLAVVVLAGWQRRRDGVARHRDRVVLQVLPDCGDVGDRADSRAVQVTGRADA